ncbi:MAG: Hsp20 family protein [Candidatus Baltobacteraceae bacterium]|jgi:HSP20 family protein
MADSQLQPTRGPLAARTAFGELLGFDPFRNFFTGFGQVAGLDVTRDDAGGYTVEIPVAGFKPNEIDVTLEDDVLTITGKTEKRQFRRSLLLPEDIDSENIGAKVENGLLTLTLRAHPKAQPKKIAVTYEQ